MLRSILIGACAVLASGCVSAAAPIEPQAHSRPGPGTHSAGPAQTELEFARATLEAIQQRSIEEDREYCGYMGLTADNQWWAAPPRRGEAASCLPKDVPSQIRITASYHTHAGYAVEYFNELPSDADMRTDIDMNINGYISTPGGRFWYIDGKRETATLVCGERCLFSDPNYRPQGRYKIEWTYTLEEIERGPVMR